MQVNRCWVGIDCGFSQMSLAIVDAKSRVLVVERTREPRGDGHDREVALARLRRLLARLETWRRIPVALAGYCYDHAGVHEAFAEAGWNVVETKPLNDVVGIYGLTEMAGHAVVGGCGSWPQVVYVDAASDIFWPGDDVATRLPEWPLSGWSYAKFLIELSTRDGDPRWSRLRRLLRERLGSKGFDVSNERWSDVGPLLKELLDYPEVREYLARAADTVLEIRDVLWQESGRPDAPKVIVGGGSVREEKLWEIVESELHVKGVEVERVTGEHAVGLARYAMRHPDANPWSVVGNQRPAWLG